MLTSASQSSYLVACKEDEWTFLEKQDKTKQKTTCDQNQEFFFYVATG